jgi:branched-subunit amino acid transport protein
MSFWVIAVIGALTFAIRASFLVGPRPHWEARLRPYLQRLPAAVLPALAASALVGTTAGPEPRLLAVAAAAAVAWRTRSIAGAMVAGMLVFWALRFAGA